MTIVSVHIDYHKRNYLVYMVIKTNNSSKNSNNLKYNITAGIKSLKKYEKKKKHDKKLYPRISRV